jgi:hypothetical protein
MGRILRRLSSVEVAGVSRVNTADVLWAFGSCLDDRDWDGRLRIAVTPGRGRALHPWTGRAPGVMMTA